MTTALLAPTLEAACDRWPDRPAVSCDGAVLTYADLGERVRRLSRALLDLGVAPGDRIVCQLPNGPEYLIGLHAAWACGAVHVGVDKDLTAPELAALVERTEPAVVVYEAPSHEADPLASLRAVQATRPETVTVVHGRRVESGTHLTLTDLMSAPPLDPSEWGRQAGGAEDPALLLLTSGTTGKAKLVVETLVALREKMALFADAFRPGPEDVHLMYLPMAHAFGLKLTLTALSSGGHVVVMPRFTPGEALRLVTDEEVTVLPGTPTHFTLLLRHLDPERHRLGSLRWALAAAAPFPPSVLEQVYSRLDVELMYVYGCSEGFLTLTTDRDEIRRGSVGTTVFAGPDRTGPNGAVAVVDIETRTPLGAGETGEIVFGTSSPVRYWGEEPAATRGWYHTGDLGRIEADGCLYVTGRLKDVVNRGGLKVGAGEVETALLRHPGVTECAVLAAPDPVLGEAICACVVPAGDSAPDLFDVRSFLSRTLARHKLPDELCVLPELPRSKVGKLDRRALARLMTDGGPARQRFRTD